MSIKQQLDTDLKEAMKAKDAARLNAIKMLKAAVRNTEIDKMKELDDSGVIEVLSREAKKMKDALEQFRAGNRDDLVASAEKEIALIEAYLPAKMSEDEIMAIVKAKIADAGQVTAKDFGSIMKSVVTETKGRSDGATISRLVKEALGG